MLVRAKILMQLMWLAGKEWDEAAEAHIHQPWEEFRSQLPLLEEIRVPRWFGTTNQSEIHIHGFSDASEKAMAAVIYIVGKAGDSQDRMVAAKTK